VGALFRTLPFAGIRPSEPDGEITKLKPEAVDLDAGVISVSAEVSKVREPRKVVIQPNLAAWLRTYPLERFRLPSQTSTGGGRESERSLFSPMT